MVFILPEDINLTSGSPRYHRSFLDIYLSQYSRAYLYDLLEYQRVLKQRNALLKSLKEGEKKSAAAELDAWDNNLMAPALKIMNSRRKFLREIEAIVGETVSKLSGSRENVGISYKPSIDVEEYDDTEVALDFFRQFRKRDKKYGTTVAGPHRDTIEIIMNRKPLREFGSLGQKKSVMIAMKLAALEVISSHLRDRAILVLDEAFAEFDSGRTRSLLNLLSAGGQVFLASADEKEIVRYYEKIRIFRVADGKVTED